MEISQKSNTNPFDLVSVYHLCMASSAKLSHRRWTKWCRPGTPANLLKMNFAAKVKNFPFVLQVSPSAGNRQLSKDCSPSNPMLINDRLPLSSSSFITMCALEFGHNVVPNWKYLRRLHKYIHTFLMLASKEYRWKQTKLLLSLSVSRCYAVFCWCSYSLVNYLWNHNAPLLK